MPQLTASLNELLPFRFEASQRSIENYANTLTEDADVLQVTYNFLPLPLRSSIIYLEYISGYNGWLLNVWISTKIMKQEVLSSANDGLIKLQMALSRILTG